MISVIVPVYKSEKFLSKCVDSILGQTYHNLELLLVDDGSPDNCPAICDAYAARDSRVRVIHKQNGGVSTARNAGMEAASGDYITFVDSDDYIEPNMYEKMMSYAQEYDCDIVMCDCVKEYPDQKRAYTHDIRGGFYNHEQLKKEYYPHLLMMENVEYPATISNWTILWRHSLYTLDLCYEPGIRFSEDLLFGARLMRHASSFYYLKGERLYHYVIHPQSASHSYVPDKWDDYQRLHQRIRDTFSQDPQFDFSHQIDLCLLFFLYNTVGDIYGANLSDQEKKNKILSILRTPTVQEMFGRLNIHSLPIPPRLKLLTMLYRYQFGISVLIKYFQAR